MRRSHLVFVILAMLVAFPPALSAAQHAEQDITLPPWRRELPGGREQVQIVVGETPLTVDLAYPGTQQTLGLGYRNGLEPGTGMFFIGDRAVMKTYWMKGMRFCLDIIWIENDQIMGAAESVCPDPPGTADLDRARYSSPVSVTHVLEVPAGWLDEHGYGSGTPVDLSEIPDI